MLKGKLSKSNFYNWYEANYNNKYSKNKLYKVLLNGTIIGYGFFTGLNIQLLHNSTILLNRVVFISNSCIPSGYAPNREDNLVDGYELMPISEADLSNLVNSINFITEELKNYSNGKGSVNWEYHLDSIKAYADAVNFININKIINSVKCLN